jgi:hypothetical protein
MIRKNQLMEQAAFSSLIGFTSNGILPLQGASGLVFEWNGCVYIRQLGFSLLGPDGWSLSNNNSFPLPMWQ